MGKEFSYTVESRKDIITNIFLVIIMCFSLFFIDSSEFKLDFGNEKVNKAISIFILILLYVICIYRLLWSATGKLFLSIQNSNFLVRKYIAGIATTKNYELSEIKDISVKYNTKETSSWDLGGYKIYDRNPVIIEFAYKNKKIVIGKNCQSFDGKGIVSELKKCVKES